MTCKKCVGFADWFFLADKRVSWTDGLAAVRSSVFSCGWKPSLRESQERDISRKEARSLHEGSHIPDQFMLFSDDSGGNKVLPGKIIPFKKDLFPWGNTFFRKNEISLSKGTEIGIDDAVFMHCSGLKSVTIPVSVMRIVSYCFDDRTNLTNLIYPENHESGYLEDNVIYKTDGITPGKITDPSIPIDVLEEKPIWLDGLSALPSKDVPSSIMTYGGARPADRDAVDKRLIEEFKNGTGGIPNSQNDVGGYPAAEATYRKLNVP